MFGSEVVFILLLIFLGVIAIGGLGLAIGFIIVIFESIYHVFKGDFREYWEKCKERAGIYR